MKIVRLLGSRFVPFSGQIVEHTEAQDGRWSILFGEPERRMLLAIHATCPPPMRLGPQGIVQVAEADVRDFSRNFALLSYPRTKSLSMLVAVTSFPLRSVRGKMAGVDKHTRRILFDHMGPEQEDGTLRFHTMLWVDSGETGWVRSSLRGMPQRWEIKNVGGVPIFRALAE